MSVFHYFYLIYEKSNEIYEELSRKDPNHYNYRHRYAYALWQTGKYDSAELMFDIQIQEFEKELELGRIERNDPYYNLAGIYAFLGEEDKAIEYLKKHKFTSGLEIYVEYDPLFTSLRDNQAFITIIENAKAEKELLRDKIKIKVAEDFGL